MFVKVEAPLYSVDLLCETCLEIMQKVGPDKAYTCPQCGVTKMGDYNYPVLVAETENGDYVVAECSRRWPKWMSGEVRSTTT